MAFNEEDWSADQRAIRENIGDAEFGKAHRQRLIRELSEAVLRQRHLKDQTYAHSRQMWNEMRAYSKQIDGSEEGDFGRKLRDVVELRSALTQEVDALRSALDLYRCHDETCDLSNPPEEGAKRCCSCGFADQIASLANLEGETLSAQQRLLQCTCAAEEADFPWHNEECPAGRASELLPPRTGGPRRA